MSESPTANWTGASGTSYTYYWKEIPNNWDFNYQAKAGNYIFAKVNANNRWEAVYVGQTSDLSERFDNHHAKPCITRHGATHIHAHLNSSSERERRTEESDLIASYTPPCNKVG